MPALPFLGNLGAIGGGYLNTQDQLQQQQLRQIYAALAAQQMQQQQQQMAAQAPTFQALRSGNFDNLFGQGGATSQAPAPAGLPQVPSFGSTGGMPQQLPPPPPPPTASGMGIGGAGFNPTQAPFPTRQNDVRDAATAPLPMRTAYDPSSPVGTFRDIGGSLVASPAQDIRSDIHAAAGPDALAAAQPATSQTLRALGNPLAVAGRLNPSQLAQAIDKAIPGVPDEVKMTVFGNLYPLLSQQGQSQFKQMWDEFKFFQEEKDRGRRLDIEAGRASQTAAHETAMEDIARGQEGIAAGRAAQTASHEAATEAETRRYHDIIGAGRETKTAQAVDKARATVQNKIDEQESLARDADQLAAMVEQNPKLVGVKGIIGRTTGAIGENILGIPEDPGIASFKNRINMLQARLQRTLLGSRYYSGLAQRKLDEIVPALGIGVTPSQTLSALRDVSATLRSEAKAQSQTLSKTKISGEAAAPDYSSMTDEQLIELSHQPEQ